MGSVFEINVACNWGSTGRIAEEIGVSAKQQGWSVYFAHGARYITDSSLTTLQVSSPWEEKKHWLKSVLFDAHGLGSTRGTISLIKYMDTIEPDVVHLHNIHGYYINYEILFDYLKKNKIPVVWTLHDCWSFTGHCAYFDSIGCEKWMIKCHDCKLKGTYPPSKMLDRSKRNYELKRKIFTSVREQTVIVPVSFWLEGLVKQSFLKDFRMNTIYNGINIGAFKPSSDELCKTWLKSNKKIILGVALPWSQRKGLPDMLKLAELLPKEEYQVVLVGLDEKQIASLPDGVLGIVKTNSVQELAKYYSLATVFVNPTYEDNFPTNNIEALACGTPVITYRTGGSPEAISSKTGWIVEKGDVQGVAAIIKEMSSNSKNEIENQRKACRERAEKEFDKEKAFKKYLDLYSSLTE